MDTISITYKVNVSGVLVGYLIRHETGQVAFRFDEKYWTLNQRPVLGQKFEDDRREIYRGRNRNLPAFFANLVPEGQMRTLITHSLGIDESDELALLNATGDDLPGAITISPANEFLPFPMAAENNNGHVDSFQSQNKLNVEPLKLRFSLAGVQMKFSVIHENAKLLLPAKNNLGHWIAKIDSLRFPRLTENEFAIMEWARAAGFNVPECILLGNEALPENLRDRAPENSKVFLIKRYDRIKNERIHQEDFAQVLFQMPEKKYDYASYEFCARLVLNICGREGYKEFLRRLVLMVASGNVDAHLKNWSLLYPDGVNATLTPLYDQVCTIAWPNTGLDMRWALTFMKRRDLFVTDESLFASLIKASGGDLISDMKLVRETLINIAEAWSGSIAQNILPKSHLELLMQYWQKVPLLRDYASAITY